MKFGLLIALSIENFEDMFIDDIEIKNDSDLFDFYNNNIKVVFVKGNAIYCISGNKEVKTVSEFVSLFPQVNIATMNCSYFIENLPIDEVYGWFIDKSQLFIISKDYRSEE